jgi:hypothetical protein
MYQQQGNNSRAFNAFQERLVEYSKGEVEEELMRQRS